MKYHSLLIFSTLFTSLVLSQQSVLDNFQCLDSPKVITYNNSGGEPELPQVRIMMCGYSSQCALNMVAYLHMKERLGMNVTFHPTTNYDIVWNGEFWENWANSAYPRLYFEWLYADDMDLNFEFWPTQLVRTSYDGTVTFDGQTDYVLSGKIDFGGFVGAYGEESIWLPKYYVDANPTSIIPQSVRDDGTFRQALMSGSRDGPTNYLREYNTSNSFDTTNEGRPIVWGSSPGYFMSQYANDLKNNAIEGGMNVSFVTTGGEGSLATLIKDLYSQRVPFLANIYTIDDNFGIIGNETSGELQEFEKIAFARNPDQSAYDPCFLAKECQYPIGPLMKAANPKLESSFPEAHEFFVNFNIGTRQLNQIVANYWTGNSSLGGTERWLQAACDWMKSSDADSISTWNNSAWMVDVKRVDCLNGCGITADDGEEVGGTCNYYKGLCECSFAQLFEDGNCQTSCPGLDGPYINSSASSSDDSDYYYFNWCSGHGECDTITRLCSCDLGYGGDGCQTKYEEYLLPLGLQVVIILLSCILAIACIGCIVWLRMSAEYKTVKALSVNMTTIMTFGLLMIVCSNIALSQKVSSVSCIAWQWLFGLGGILAIMSPLLKAYRVSRVFHGGKMLRAVKITDKMLMAMLIKCAIVEGLICIGYSVIHELFGGSTLYYNDEELRVEDQCNDNALTGYISMGSYAYFFVMLCALTKYSYGTRRALSVFKESTCAYFSSFLSLLCTLITFVFYMATKDPTFRTAIQSFAIILVVSAVLLLFYGTRIYTFYNEPENRNVTDTRAATHTSTSSAHTSVMKPGPSSQA